MAYRFITNFKREELLKTKIALTAAGITDYKFCKTAKDAFGNVLPDCYALYFEEGITPKAVKLFYYSLATAAQRLAEKENQ